MTHLPGLPVGRSDRGVIISLIHAPLPKRRHAGRLDRVASSLQCHTHSRHAVDHPFIIPRDDTQDQCWMFDAGTDMSPEAVQCVRAHRLLDVFLQVCGAPGAAHAIKEMKCRLDKDAPHAAQPQHAHTQRHKLTTHAQHASDSPLHIDLSSLISSPHRSLLSDSPHRSLLSDSPLHIDLFSLISSHPPRFAAHVLTAS